MQKGEADRELKFSNNNGFSKGGLLLIGLSQKAYQKQLKLFSFTILNLLKTSCSPRNESHLKKQKEILTKKLATSGISSQTKIAAVMRFAGFQPLNTENKNMLHQKPFLLLLFAE